MKSDLLDGEFRSEPFPTGRGKSYLAYDTKAVDVGQTSDEFWMLLEFCTILNSAFLLLKSFLLSSILIGRITSYDKVLQVQRKFFISVGRVLPLLALSIANSLTRVRKLFSQEEFTNSFQRARD